MYLCPDPLWPLEPIRRLALRALPACLFLCLTLLPATARAAEKDILRVGVEKGYRPFAYVDEQGRLTGFDVDIAKALCACMQRECEFLPMDFEELLPALVAGKIDLLALGLGITPERQKLVDFTDHYFRSQSIFIEKPGTVKGLDLAAMAGKRVGVQPGSIQEEHLRKAYGQEIVLVPRADFEKLFAGLQRGEVDIILVDGLPGYTLLKSPLGSGLETLGDPVTGAEVATSAHMAVAKSQTELREQINKAIKEIVRNGEYAKINRKYFEFNVY